MVAFLLQRNVAIPWISVSVSFSARQANERIDTTPGIKSNEEKDATGREINVGKDTTPSRLSMSRGSIPCLPLPCMSKAMGVRQARRHASSSLASRMKRESNTGAVAWKLRTLQPGAADIRTSLQRPSRSRRGSVASNSLANSSNQAIGLRQKLLLGIPSTVSGLQTALAFPTLDLTSWRYCR